MVANVLKDFISLIEAKFLSYIPIQAFWRQL